MEKCKRIKKPIVILQASYDERYLICIHSRAKFSVLNTQTDTFVFEENIRPATTVCFSADDREIYVYDSGKKTVKIIAVETWETVGLIEIPEFRKADKNNFGHIYPTKAGFCIDFGWKGVMDGERLRWNMLFYDRATGEKRIFEDCAHENFDRATGETLVVWRHNAYAVLSIDRGVERQFYRNEEACEDGIVLSHIKYSLKTRKKKDEYAVQLLSSPLEKTAWSEVCKYTLDFSVSSYGMLMQKDRFVFQSVQEHRFAVADQKGRILAQASGKYAFSGVTARGKLYLADWTELIVVPYE